MREVYLQLDNYNGNGIVGARYQVSSLHNVLLTTGGVSSVRVRDPPPSVPSRPT